MDDTNKMKGWSRIQVYKEGTMTSPKPGRREFVKLGLASATAPLLSPALTRAAAPRARSADAQRAESPVTGGSTVSLGSGLQIYYKDEWLGVPWLTGEPVLLLHGNLETHEIWFGWVPRMAQQFRLLRPDLPALGARLRRAISNGRCPATLTS
jgi:hypothetical protein